LTVKKQRILSTSGSPQLFLSLQQKTKLSRELGDHYVLPAVPCSETFNKEQPKSHTANVSSAFSAPKGASPFFLTVLTNGLATYNGFLYDFTNDSDTQHSNCRYAQVSQDRSTP